jgi:hypothetical protein
VISLVEMHSTAADPADQNREAAEYRLRCALMEARTAYERAAPAEKGAARHRYLEALRTFSQLAYVCGCIWM